MIFRPVVKGFGVVLGSGIYGFRCCARRIGGLPRFAIFGQYPVTVIDFLTKARIDEMAIVRLIGFGFRRQQDIGVAVVKEVGKLPGDVGCQPLNVVTCPFVEGGNRIGDGVFADLGYGLVGRAYQTG